MIGWPLGDRRMVDGQCLSGGEAETTSLCTTGGIRFPAPLGAES